MSLEFQNWIFHCELPPAWHQGVPPEVELKRTDELRSAVQKVIGDLPEDEERIIRLVYYDGLSTRDIARRTNLPATLVNSTYRRAMRRLRGRLRAFAKSRFRLPEARDRCIICSHPERAEIDKLIRARRKDEPYSVLFRRIKSEFGVRLISTKTVIGHIKYHG